MLLEQGRPIEAAPQAVSCLSVNHSLQKVLHSDLRGQSVGEGFLSSVLTDFHGISRDNVCSCLLLQPDEFRNGILRQGVIRIDEQKTFARGSLITIAATRHGSRAVIMANHAKGGMLLRILLNNGQRSVRTLIVDDDDLHLLMTLTHDGIQASADERLCIAQRNNNRNFHLNFFLFNTLCSGIMPPLSLFRVQRFLPGFSRYIYIRSGLFIQE